MSIDHREDVATLGQGCTTGHQNRNPAQRNEACSTTCHVSDCSASVNAAGTCHPTHVVAPAIQQTAGCASARKIRCLASQRNNGPKMDCTNCRGKPCSKGIKGAPSQIKRGPRVMSSKCWTM